MTHGRTPFSGATSPGRRAMPIGGLWFNLAAPPWSMASSLALFAYLAALGLTAKRSGS